GAGHCVGEPDIKRNLGTFSCRPHEQKQSNRPQNAKACFSNWKAAHHFFEDDEIVDTAEGAEDQKDAENETDIANPVHHESLLGCISCFPCIEVITDEQIGTKTDSFPADEHQQLIVRQNQDAHHKDEQIEVSEVAIES